MKTPPPRLRRNSDGSSQANTKICHLWFSNYFGTKFQTSASGATERGRRKVPGYRSVRLSPLLSILCSGILCDVLCVCFCETISRGERDRQKDREERSKNSYLDKARGKMPVIYQFPRTSKGKSFDAKKKKLTVFVRSGDLGESIMGAFTNTCVWSD